MWVLFDIDATLVDHDAAFRVGGEALYRASSCALGKDAFLARWSAAHRRSFDRFLNGELTYDEQRRARMLDTFGADLPEDDIERLFAIYLAAYENAWTLFPDVRPSSTRSPAIVSA